jgi:diacylglycerol kinase (ATP)
MINLFKNLKNSIAGFRAALSDNSFRAEIVLGLVTIPFLIMSESVGMVLKFTAIGTYVLLLVVELINTAIERLCDRVTMDFDRDIKAVKDMTSGAVLLVLLAYSIQCLIAVAGVLA